ncbi:FHA domain-containing protein [Bradymonadaceae bacterium TMQ3]|uniref:FHA domain-containing protein n=1 Tax=Lujinxingia sediminis TaxID=2480984 RepID=A0ABY0CYA7_9DELT|nr:FHA domain-containing protein [Lujinxingia sediminis]RDV39546.1 FHA domain-containing protein [Bradymonadaceae bacterium TMQ3]RVU48410.1 FHA domain-containing protein [Lujinxingia sediminis]TXC77711.1 FHA domain-containing protein [Bradymonadales bacterium TMQ1]
MFTITIEDQNGQVADTFSFDHGSYVVGRLDTCDVVLPSGSVSREHARIFVHEGRCYIEDLGSANGVIVDGQRVVQQRDLGTASQIRIGDYYLYLEFKRSARMQNQNVLSTLFIDSGSEHHKLVRINDAFAGEEFSLSEVENTIGRTDENFILLSDASISRRHAIIARHGDLYSVVDCGSSNGTRLNGKAVQSQQAISPGDRVEFGNLEFVFVEGNATVNPAEYAASGSSNAMTTYGGLAVLVLLGLALGGAAVFALVNSGDGEGQAQAHAPAPPTLEEQVAEHVAGGRTQLELGNWDGAIAAANEALALAPQNTEARALRDQVDVERQAAEKLAQGELLSEQGRHEEAREMLLQLPQGSIAEQRAQTTLAHLNRTIAYNLRSEASRLFKSRREADPKAAHALLVEALEVLPEDQESRALLDDVEAHMRKKRIAFESYAPAP